MHPRRAGESWLPKEDEQLKHELMIGMPFHQIAERHQRTVGAIDARLDRYVTAADVQQEDEVATYIRIETNGKRVQDLMKQNDELSDRIHLDLDPRIKRLTKEFADSKAQYIKRLAELVTEKGELKLSNKRYLVELQAFDKMNNELHMEIADLKSRLEWDREQLRKVRKLAGSAL